MNNKISTALSQIIPSPSGFLCRAALFVRAFSVFTIRSIALASLLIISSKLNVFATTGQALDSWTSMANAVPTGSGSGACIVYAEKAGKGKVYNLRGGGNLFGIYDIETNVFVSTTNLPFSAATGSAMTWDGGNFIYLLGGGTNFYQYDITASTFTSLEPPPASVAGGGAIVYVSTQTGLNWCYAYQGGSTAFWRYDINTSSWVVMAVAPASAASGSALSWANNEFVYGVIGGTAQMRRYNINTNSWTTLASQTAGNFGAGGSLAYPAGSNVVYAFRGGTSTTTLKYTISPESWVFVSSAPLTIGTNAGNKLVGYGDYIYGRRGLTTDDFWRYRWRDVDPPGKITSFVAETGALGGQINLSWVSPGNDNYTGDLPIGSTFYIQYASWTGVNFSTTTQPPVGGYHIWIPTGPVTQGTTRYYTVGGLSEGVTHYFRTWSRDNAGNWSPISDGATTWAQVTPPASAPTDLSATSLSSATISLAWSLSGAATYWVEHSSITSPYNWVWRSSVPAPGNSYTDINLIPGTTYWYRLIALNAVGSPNYAVPSNITSTLTYTAAPVGFTKTAVSTASITWSWTPVGFSDGFRIYQATSPTTVVATVPFSQTYYEETGLSTNTAYGRFARAYNIMGESPDSNHATFYTLAAAPSNLSVTAVYQSSVTLTWQSNGNPDGTKYGLARAEDGSFTVNHTTFVGLADNLALLTTDAVNLGGNTTYYFRVWAYNEEDIASAYSNIASTSTPPAPPAAPVGLFGVAVSTTIIKWEWDITANATFYRIYSPPNTLLANLDGPGATTWFENALSSNTQYTRYVKAGNDQGLSGDSVTASRYTLAYPPESLTATAVSSSTINLSWPGSGAKQYQIFSSTVGVRAAPVSNPANVNSPTLAHSHQALTAGVTHYYWIVAVNGDDIAYDAFNFPTISTRTWPSPVVSLSSSAATTTSITWTWPAALGADGYLILMATSPSTVVGQTDAAQTSFVSTNLSTNTAYGRVVRAYNTSGVGVVSPSATFYTLAAVPGTPVVDGVTTNSVSLSWPAGGNPSGTRYGVIRSQDNFASTATLVGYNGALTLTSYTDNSVSEGTAYQYKVAAFNGDAVVTEYTAFVSTVTNPLPNLLTNGDFEIASEPGTNWFEASGVRQNGRTTFSYADTYSLFITTNRASSTSNRCVYQNVSVIAGKQYKLSGYVYKDSANSPWVGLSMLPGGGGYSSTVPEATISHVSVATTTATSGSWVFLSMSTIPAAGVSTLGINLVLRITIATAATSYFDNITFAEIPDTKPPDAISNLTALPGSTDGEINLAWSAPSDDGLGVKSLTGGYTIKYSSVQIINSADFNAPSFAHGSVVISTSGVTPGAAVGYTISLTPGASYWFAIKSSDTAGNLSVWNSSANVASVNTAAYAAAQDFPPPAPTTLAATPSDTIIMLTWSAGGTITDLSRYELYCDSTSAYDFADQFLATATLNTSFTHAGLDNGVTYYYRVRAVDTPPNILSSGYSNIVSTFPRPTAPLAPSLDYDLAQTTTFQIRWVMTDNASNETGLHISSDTNIGARRWSSAGLGSTGGTTSWIETGFGANEAVTRYAEASNGIGSNWSGAVTRYTRAIAPSGLSADAVYFSSAAISWSANGNPSGTRYEVSFSSDIFNLYYSTPITLADGHIFTTADITGLAGGATYWFRARAYNDDSVATAFSSTISVVTNRLPTLYLKVANPGFESGASAADMPGWSKEGTATSITRNTTIKRSGSYSCKFDDPTSSYGGRRIVSSTATVVGGNNYSVGAWFYVEYKSGVIQGTTIQIGIRWIDNSNNIIYVSTSSGVSLSAFNTWEKLTYSDVAPANAVSAVMSIDARNSTSAGASTDDDFYIDDVDNAPDTIAPGAITNLAAAKGANPGEVNLTWTAVGDDGYVENNGASAVYTIRYATYPMVAASSWTWRNSAVVYYQAWPVAAVGTTESRILSLAPGVTYYFLARTQDAAGNISYFDVKSIETPQASACAKEGVIGGVRINEVGPDQTSGQGYDFIELYNPGPDTPNIFGWEFFDYYTQDVFLEKVEGSWNFPANSYLVLRANTSLVRNMTSPVTVSANHYELISNKAGFSQTDNVIMVSTGGAGATILDAVCYADMSGSLTNSTRLRAAYNAAISTGQWFGPLADGSNDATVERYMASSLYNTSSNWAIARNNLSTDGTNPSYMEWAMNHTTTRGGPNGAFDATPPAAVGNLAVVPGANRGTMRVTWTAVGDDANTGTASGYLLKTRTDTMTGDNFDSSVNYAFASKEGQTDTDRWAPKASGQAESYLIGGFNAGTTYFIGLKVQDERPNTSNLSNIVSTMAANVIGSNVRINEIATLTAGADWIEFYCGTGPVNVNGWQLLSIVTGGASETTFKTLPDITLQTGDYLVYNCVAGTDETNASGKGANGYWDVYGVNDPDGFRGVVTLKDNFANIVDFLAYSQGTEPTWGPIWTSAAAWKQWAPASASVVAAADWSTGDASKSLGRDGFSTDTDDTAQSKNDWKIFLVPTKGAQNDDIPPGAITNLSALADAAVEGKITLTWTAPGDDGYVGNNSGGYYMVKYATFAVSASSWTWWNSISTSVASDINKGWTIKTPSAVGATETLVFTGLYPATTYYFAARSADDMSNWSELDAQIGVNSAPSQAQAVVSNLPPSAPSGVSAVSSNTAVLVSWSANSELDLQSYRISSNTVNDFSGATPVATVPAASLAFNVGGLTNGVAYYFWVQAIDVFGLSGSTSSDGPAVPIIRPPSGLSLNHDGAAVRLAWTASPDAGAPNFAGYSIYRSSVSALSGFNLVTSLTGGGATTHYDTSGVVATQTYYYFLRSSDTAGPESFATAVSTAVPDDKGPAITAVKPTVSTVTVAVKGSKIIIEAFVADDATTPYISGVNSGTVSVAYSTGPGVTTYLPLDMAADSASYDGSRLMSATFRKELTAATAGISAPLQSILTVGGTFYFYFYAVDNVANYTVGAVTYKVIIQAEQKTSAAVTASAGGEVTLSDGNPDDGETSVTIPAGALSRNVTVTIEQADPASTAITPAAKESTIEKSVNSGRPIAVYIFGPEGTIFAKPVTITLLYFEEGGVIKDNDGVTIAGAAEDDLRIYRWDGVEWRFIGGTVDKIKNTVSTKVSHFSVYALFNSKGAPPKPVAMERFITPNSDGINDRLEFDGSPADFKEIIIYDINGRPIRKLEGESFWDAKDDAGKVAEIGAYIWRAVYTNGTSNYGTVVVAK